MIEISHAQARFLIRQSLDARAEDGRRMPEEQWTALQAHLESCAECRAYQQRVMGMERGLRRGLAARWRNVSGPEGMAGIPAARAAARLRRETALSWARRAGLAALILLGIGALVLWNRARREAAALPAPTPSSAATATPTPAAYFDGLVAYAALPAGEDQSDIFLLQSHNERVEINNLTNSSGADTDPAWSPDGEWIAFLSDRDGGKRELYVTNITGSRVIQLTHGAEQGLDWQGPPAWSPDGTLIALTGKRLAQEGLSWLYLVPVDGASVPPIPVPGSRGIHGPTRLLDGPGDSTWIIFQQALPNDPEGRRGSIVRVSMPDAGQDDLTAVDAASVGARPLGAFDARGENGSVDLAYAAAGRDNDSLRSLNTNIRYQFALDITPTGRLGSVTFLPRDPRVAYLVYENRTQCWTLNLRPADVSGPALTVPDLCVAEDLTPGQWSRDGEWGVLVSAAGPAQPSPRLWALRVPPLGAGLRGLSSYALAPVDGLVGAPQVRPNAPRLEINPQPAQPAAVEPPLSPVPAAFGDQKLLASLPQGENSRIESLDPDGTQRTLLQEADAFNACPVISPDGSRMAYLSNRASIYPYLYEVYIRDLANPGARDLMLYLPNIYYSGYDCPVWSPDGSAIAVVVRAFGLSYLAVFAMDGAQPPVPSLPPGVTPGPTRTPVPNTLESGVYLTIEVPSVNALPVWSPDSRTIYLPIPRRIGFPPAIILYRWRGPGQDLSSPGPVLILEGWDEVAGLSLSPDGQFAALSLVRWPNAAARPGTLWDYERELRVYERLSWRLVARQGYQEFQGGIARPGHIFWQPGGQVIFGISGWPFTIPATFLRFDPHDSTMQILAISPDVVNDWTVLDNWLVFASESGLWGVTLPEPGSSPAPPAYRPRRLAPDIMRTLSAWK